MAPRPGSCTDTQGNTTSARYRPRRYLINRKTPLALALRAALLGGALGATGVLPQFAWAQAAPAGARQYDIAPGTLDQTLGRFGREAGVMIAIDPELTGGLRSEGLRGTYTVPEALSVLLSGQQLEAVSGPSGGYRLRRRNAVPTSATVPAEPGVATLAEVIVSTSAARDGTTEGTGSYTTNASNTATRLGLTLRETPQSVSVITRQQMDDQGLTQLTDVLAQTPGLTVSQSGNLGSDSSAIYSRGFAVENYQLDGVPQLNSNYNSLFQTADMAIYDRVEVVRGATGLMNGMGSPAATINLVRKKPTQDFQASVSVEGGSWDYRRFGADISSPLNQAGTLRGRFVAAYQENNGNVERYHEKREVFYGVVEADITPKTLATVGFSYQSFDITGIARSGLPLYFDDGTRTAWSRSMSAAADWAYSYRKSQTVFGSLEHRFDNNWRVKGTLSYDKTAFDEVLGYAGGGYPNQLTGAGVNLWAGRWSAKPEQTSVDLYATGPLYLFGQEHELVVGSTLARTVFTGPTYGLWSFDGWSGDIANIYTWNGSTPPAPNNPPNGKLAYTEQLTSAYATARLRPTDALSVLLGARVTSWRTNSTTSYDTGESYVDDRKENGKITPYAGLVLDFSKHWSAYASYTNIFKPQSNRAVNGDFLDPLIGNGYEIGTKSAFFDNRLNLSGALYWIKQDNLAVAIPGAIAPDGSQAYYAASGTKTKGFELEAAGQITPSWQANIAFTRNLTTDADGKALNTNIPQDSFKLFTTYRFGGFARGLTAGGGVRWQNQIYSEDMGPLGVRFTQGSYAVVDLMARYQFTPKIAATLNVYNLLDKNYYTSTSSSFYGTPRSVRLGLNVSY
ncbi:TonB-dependent siderophore receptor [Cupriavidus sp. 30B13]|uniref:TonB-dependent siderophore receptor n=1 Tax=Cupriavidus sp. 30B13 TaxID=3384241 RepID=UPI003B8F5B11